MEDYDTFVRNRFSQLKKKEEEHKAPAASSVICFYGTPILPPVLTGKRRQEMQQHRKAAQENAVGQKFKDNQKMAYVQTILHSVQLRNSPTLEDLLEELKVDAKSLCSPNVSECTLQSADTVQEKTTRPLLSLPCCGLLSSTTNDTLVPSRVMPQLSNEESCPVEQDEKQQASQPGSFNSVNHWSASSGYVTHENMKNATDASESLDLQSVSSVGTNNANDFFLHNTSNTIARMPDIISYPPIDGEELERSGQESPFCHDFIGRVDSSCWIIPEDSVTSDHFPGEKSANGPMDSAKSPVKFPCTSLLHKDEGQKSVPWKSCCSSDIPKSSQSPHIDCCPSTEQLECDPGKMESADKQIPQAQSQPPHRPSLQDLLKKSQEYRRQQRMLRNQARHARIQERAQEQPRVEEQSLSDKENDEFRCKSTEGRKPKERRCLFNKTVHATCKKNSETLFQEALIGKKANPYSERVPRQIPFPQQQHLSIETCQTRAVYQTTNAAITFVEAQANHHSIPVPSFSQSPVYSQASSRDGAENFTGKAQVCSRFSERHKAEEGGNLGQQGDVPSVLADDSQHLKQLESCLFSLKEVISDLGSSILDIEGKWEDRSDVQGHQCVSRRQFLDSCRNVLEKSDEQKNSNVDNVSSVPQAEGKEEVQLSKLSLVNTFTTEGANNEKGFHKSSGQPPLAKCSHPVAQGMQIPDVFTSALSDPTLWQNVSVLSHHTERKSDVTEDCDSSTHLLSLNQSYDVDTPSGMWDLEGSGSDQGSSDDLTQGEQLNTEGVVGTEGTSSKQVLMHESLDRSAALTSGEDMSEGKPRCSTPTATSPWRDSREEELRQVHAAQVSALQEEHRRQQEELLQALAARYQLVQSSSLLCSRLGDTMTFSKLCQPPNEHLEHCRPLLLAAVKGYLTRRLLRTERVAQLVRTIGLRVARYEVYSIFFCLSVTERMQLISLDRELARERVLRRQMGHTHCPKGRSSLSAATQKSLQRKRGMLIQRKVSERHKTGFTGVQLLETKPGPLRTKLLRISMSSNSCRPR
ncbi:uncharacterized protein si:ch73-100l22.3 isoform X2 [Dunckerocampus dactyliophorus]|uniref:uncharacterized protein si:ch73-100l22.3 isoform X2 n=1 Tax=Dunckerocampus dactyliophorus TaxID=161453 RepID=UPI002404A84B|nr:uncharacterized protein si:ch73-100l22.3 isoform X2 [Dunckerocampus dactyliophorus]